MLLATRKRPPTIEHDVASRDHLREDREERLRQPHDPGDGEEEEDPRDEGQPEADPVGALLALLRELPDEDRDEDDVVDPEDELEGGERQERDPSLRFEDPVHSFSPRNRGLAGGESIRPACARGTSRRAPRPRRRPRPPPARGPCPRRSRTSAPTEREGRGEEPVHLLPPVPAVPLAVGLPREVGGAEEVEVGPPLAAGLLDPGGAARRSSAGRRRPWRRGPCRGRRGPVAPALRRVGLGDLTPGDRLDVRGVERRPLGVLVAPAELRDPRCPETRRERPRERRLPGALRAGHDDAQRPHAASGSAARPGRRRSNASTPSVRRGRARGRWRRGAP